MCWSLAALEMDEPPLDLCAVLNNSTNPIKIGITPKPWSKTRCRAGCAHWRWCKPTKAKPGARSGSMRAQYARHTLGCNTSHPSNWRLPSRKWGCDCVRGRNGGSEPCGVAVDNRARSIYRRHGVGGCKTSDQPTPAHAPLMRRSSRLWEQIGPPIVCLS